MLGIPVVNMAWVYWTGIKLTVFLGFLSWFLLYVPDISVLLTTTMNKAFEAFGLIDGLNLHCFAGLIGLDALLNAIFNSFYVAGAFYISGIATILTVKYTLILVGIMMRI